MQGSKRSNFDLLKPYEQQLWRLGALAELYFSDDPNLIFKLKGSGLNRLNNILNGQLQPV